jgi:hypothetical protein
MTATSAPGSDVLAVARAIFHVAGGVRLSWASGIVSEASCREAIDASVGMLFRGLDRTAARS